MARKQKLKVFRTPAGFHDAYVAAPSQKAALKAWGSDADLFARGIAEVVTDEALTREPLERPGEVIKRARGTAAEHMASLPRTSGKGKSSAGKTDQWDDDPTHPTKRTARTSRSRRAAAKPEPSPKPKPKPKPKPRPSREKLEQAEHTLADLVKAQDAAEAEIRKRQRALDQERRKLEEANERERTAAERAVEREREARSARLNRWIEEQGG